jgi:Uma2 family endonuclease
MSISAKYRPYYTYEDYCQWKGHWELIEGMPYAMCLAPVPKHQIVGGNLYSLFKDVLKNNKCDDYKAYPPIDWKISEDTIVQPDLLIVCGKIEKKFLDFPPALIVEILSPSTSSKDRGEKMELYLSQKVKYYLIADPQFKKVEIYECINSRYEPVAVSPDSYSFLLDDGCIANVALTDIWE